jgi:hypothetical protein
MIKKERAGKVVCAFGLFMYTKLLTDEYAQWAPKWVENYVKRLRRWFA